MNTLNADLTLHLPNEETAAKFFTEYDLDGEALFDSQRCTLKITESYELAREKVLRGYLKNIIDACPKGFRADYRQYDKKVSIQRDGLLLFDDSNKITCLLSPWYTPVNTAECRDFSDVCDAIWKVDSSVILGKSLMFEWDMFHPDYVKIHNSEAVIDLPMYPINYQQEGIF